MAPSDTTPKQFIAESVDSAVDSSQNATSPNLTGDDAPSWLDQPNLLLDMFHLLDLFSLIVFYYGIIDQYKPVSWRDDMIRSAFYQLQVCIWKLFRMRERYVAWLQKEKAMTEVC
jgi:hypothetical protein